MRHQTRQTATKLSLLSLSDARPSISIQMSLAAAVVYASATLAALVPYVGPSPIEGNKLRDVQVSLPLPELGVVLEVADSLVAEDAGRGLFIRVLPEGPTEVTLAGGTSLCGYGAGEMCAERPSRARGRYTQFKLVGCAPVWFEGSLVSACELLQREDVDRIEAHEAVRNAFGELQTIRSDDAYQGSHRFFVPSEDAVAGNALDVSSLGIMANDLAADATTTSAEYDAASAERNLLVLVQELARDATSADTLVPTRPVPTLARSTLFTNVEPMEIGIGYGADFWMGRA